MSQHEQHTTRFSVHSTRRRKNSNRRRQGSKELAVQMSGCMQSTAKVAQRCMAQHGAASTCVPAARHDDVHCGVLRQAVHARQVAVVVADHLEAHGGWAGYRAQ